MTAAGLQSAPGARAISVVWAVGGRARRAGRRKTAVLEAACRVIADRGADATRFADVAAESGVPVSTLQYYFGSREDMLVAAFRHASGAEIAALEADVAAMSDPWERLERIVTGGRSPGTEADAPDPGRAAVDRVLALRHPRSRDAGRRAARTTGPGGDWWRTRSGTASSRAASAPGTPRRRSPVLAIALVDGMGIPLALADPDAHRARRRAGRARRAARTPAPGRLNPGPGTPVRSARTPSSRVPQRTCPQVGHHRFTCIWRH